MATLTTNDPRHIDGDPHEVAQFAGEQTGNVIERLGEVLEDFQWAARGAWMTAEEHLTGEMPNSLEFAETPQGRLLAAVIEENVRLSVKVSTLTKAASFNPRAAVGRYE